MDQKLSMTPRTASEITNAPKITKPTPAALLFCLKNLPPSATIMPPIISSMSEIIRRRVKYTPTLKPIDLLYLNNLQLKSICNNLILNFSILYDKNQLSIQGKGEQFGNIGSADRQRIVTDRLPMNILYYSLFQNRHKNRLVYFDFCPEEKRFSRPFTIMEREKRLDPVRTA